MSIVHIMLNKTHNRYEYIIKGAENENKIFLIYFIIF